MPARSTRSGGACAPAASRSSGGQNGRPSSSNRASSSRRVGERLERAHVLGGTRRAEELRAERRRLRDDERHGHAVQREPDRTPPVALEHRHDRRERGETGDDAVRIVRGNDDRELVCELAEAARCTGNLPAERRCDRRRERPAAVDRQRTRSGPLALERRPDLGLGRGADSRGVLQAAGGDRSLELARPT